MAEDDAQNLVARLVDLVTQHIAASHGDAEAATNLLIEINHLAGHLGSDSDRAAIRASLDQIIRHLIPLARVSEPTGQLLPEAMTILNQIAATTGAAPSPQTKPRKKNPTRRRGVRPITYFRRKRNGVELLVEHREGSRKDFLIPKSDYEAAIAALDEADQPLKFDDLHRRFVHHGGQNIPSQYPLRVILRFWQKHDPPLVERERSRYHPASISGGFRRVAQRALGELDHQ